MYVRMKFRDEQAEIAAGAGYGQAIVHPPDQLAASRLMTWVAGKHAARRGAFAEVVDKRGEADFEIVADGLSLVEHHHDVQAGIYLRVPFFRLWYAE
jgi:hypothetical protein